MKRFIWLIAGLIVLGAQKSSTAQIVIGAGNYGPSCHGGVGFTYKSGSLTVSGYLRSGKFYGYGWWGRPYYSLYPYPPGVVNRRAFVNVYTTPEIVAPPPAKYYDVSGVDLDLVRPASIFGPKPDAEKKPPPPEPQLPGKKVSVPKPAIRPKGQLPKGKPGGPPPKPMPFPKPKLQLTKPREEANQLIKEGLKAFQAKAYGLAALRFAKATQADKDNLLAFVLLAQAHVAFGRYERATEVIQEAMKLKKDYPDLNFKPRASLYQGMEPEFEGHLKTLQTTAKQNPKSAKALFLLAHQLWFDGQRRPALQWFRAARPLSPNPIYIDIFLNAGKPKIVVSN